MKTSERHVLIRLYPIAHAHRTRSILAINENRKPPAPPNWPYVGKAATEVLETLEVLELWGYIEIGNGQIMLTDLGAEAIGKPLPSHTQPPQHLRGTMLRSADGRTVEVIGIVFDPYLEVHYYQLCENTQCLDGYTAISTEEPTPEAP